MKFLYHEKTEMFYMEGSKNAPKECKVLTEKESSDLRKKLAARNITASAVKESWEEIRAIRNRLLADCDFTQLADFPVKKKKAWKEYRKQLRDIPENFKTPEEVGWPKQP